MKKKNSHAWSMRISHPNYNKINVNKMDKENNRLRDFINLYNQVLPV